MDIQSPKSVGGVASAGEGMTVGAASRRRATPWGRWSDPQCRETLWRIGGQTVVVRARHARGQETLR